jgi:hypothetical protein
MDILLLQAMLDKVQPTIRRDCNYSQLYKIKDQSQWDGDKWILPQMKLVKNNLPDLNGKVEYTQTNYRDRHRKKVQQILTECSIFWPRSLTTLWYFLLASAVIGQAQTMACFKMTKQSIYIGWSIHSVVRERGPEMRLFGIFLI